MSAADYLVDGVYATLLPSGHVKVGKGDVTRARAGQTYFTQKLIVLQHWPFPGQAYLKEREAHHRLRQWRCKRSVARELYKIAPESCVAILTELFGSPMPRCEWSAYVETEA